jgi:DNA-binding response OmpR family regulator
MTVQFDAPSPPSPAPRTVGVPGRADLQCSGEVRILVIDDDPATCQVIQAALAHDDFRVESVADPALVETMLQRRDEYHLIILDYVLPGLEPEQVFGWLRDFQPDASVIVITGYPSIEGVTSCLRARTYDYLTKPFQVTQLREVVLRCLEQKGLLRMTEEALCESLGAAIRERRKGLGLTLQQMSRRTGVSLGYLSQIELGKNSASIETLYRISLALGVRLADLFQAVQRPPPAAVAT